MTNSDEPKPVVTQDLVEQIARALTPALYGSNEDEMGRDLPPMQFDDVPPNWQEAFRGYARAILPIIEAAQIAARNDALDEAAKAVHRAIVNQRLKDADTSAGDYSYHALEAIRALRQISDREGT